MMTLTIFLPHLVKLDTLQMTDIPQILAKLFWDIVVSPAPTLVTFHFCDQG